MPAVQFISWERVYVRVFLVKKFKTGPGRVSAVNIKNLSHVFLSLSFAQVFPW